MTQKLRREVKLLAAGRNIRMQDFLGDLVENHLHPKKETA